MQFVGQVSVETSKDSQYVARPPLRSNTPPVVNEQSSEHSHATSAAASAVFPNRPIGIFDRMYSTCCGVICLRMSVSITAGVMQFTRIPLVASSLPSALVNPITPALAAL